MTSRRESLPTEGDLIAELQGVREAVEELYLLLDHVWRNREAIHQMFAHPNLDRAESIPQIIRCATCHADSPDSVTTALEQGWSELCADDGPVGNYIGCCPQCLDKQMAADPAAHDQDSDCTDTESLPFCCANPQLAWSGDPDYPGIVCLNCGFLAAENGSLVIRTEEEFQAERKRQEQKELF